MTIKKIRPQSYAVYEDGRQIGAVWYASGWWCATSVLRDYGFRTRREGVEHIRADYREFMRAA